MQTVEHLTGWEKKIEEEFQRLIKDPEFVKQFEHDYGDRPNDFEAWELVQEQAQLNMLEKRYPDRKFYRDHYGRLFEITNDNYPRNESDEYDMIDVSRFGTYKRPYHGPRY